MVYGNASYEYVSVVNVSVLKCLASDEDFLHMLNLKRGPVHHVLKNEHILLVFLEGLGEQFDGLTDVVIYLWVYGLITESVRTELDLSYINKPT